MNLMLIPPWGELPGHATATGALRARFGFVRDDKCLDSYITTRAYISHEPF